MAAKYVFDTNILINLQRRQPRDIYPSVWLRIDDLMQDGVVISSVEVFDELSRGDDDLSKWAKNRKEYFLPSEISIQRRVRTILSEHRGLIEGGSKANSADPFVIALAQEMNCTVVTEEVRTRNPSVPKIPDVCDSYQIRHINFVEFAREMNFRF